MVWKIKERNKEKLNFEVCLTRLLFINKVMTSVTHVFIYSLDHSLNEIHFLAYFKNMPKVS